MEQNNQNNAKLAISESNVHHATADNATTLPYRVNIDSSSGTVSCVHHELAEWAPWSGSNKCPECGSTNIEYNTMVILTTYPAQHQLRCKACGHYFSSGMFFSKNTNKDALDKLWKQDQSIINIPQVGDWPPGPQVGDWPIEPEPPSYPDITIPKKDSPMGWICPKCGRSLAPHMDSCPYCSRPNTLNITY